MNQSRESPLFQPTDPSDRSPPFAASQLQLSVMTMTTNSQTDSLCGTSFI